MVVLGLAALFFPDISMSAAAPATETLHSFVHVAYSKEFGAPGDVSSLVLDDDGFLWATATKGIVRFDGVSFQPFVPRPGQSYQQAQVTYLFPAEGGGVWMDSDTAGPSLAKDGSLTVYGEQQGYIGTRARFFRGPTGRVSSVTLSGIFEFVGGRWRRTFVPAAGMRPESATVDADGNEWLAAGDGLQVRAKEGGPWRAVSDMPEKVFRVQAGHGRRLYVRTPDALHIFERNGVTLTERARPLATDNQRALLESRTGALWITDGEGFRYISPQELDNAESSGRVPVAQRFGKVDGLTGSFAWPLVEDREGNIWVGTDGGLDLFRRAAFTSVDLPPAIHEVSVATGAAGDVWVTSETKPFLHGQLPGQPMPFGPRGAMTLALAYDGSRNVAWAANLDGLWKLGRDEAALVAPNPYPGIRSNIDCIAVDSGGRVVTCPPGVATIPKSWNGLVWSDLPALPGAAGVAVFDKHDTLWLGIRSQPILVRIRGTRIDVFSRSDGLATGPVRALYPDDSGIWIGGDAGVQHFDGKAFLSLRVVDSASLASTTGIVESDSGHLWIQTLDGVMRSRQKNVASWIGGSREPLAFDVLTQKDGLSGAPDPDRTLPTLRKGPDGRIWAQTVGGLSWIDPTHVSDPTVPAAPRIDSVWASGALTLPPFDRLRLLPDQDEIRIGYATATLTKPEGVHFSYRLVGLSDEWDDAGSRREATFTNLPPGRFRFEVRAFNALGKTAGTTTLVFERLPSLHETGWFRLLLLLPFGGALWLAYHLRTRSITRKLKIRAEEREAVARDIHDTLIQRFQGLTLTIQTWSSDTSLPERHRTDVARLVDEARCALIEGRERIGTLRSSQDHGLGLYDELSNEGSRLSDIYGVPFILKVSGIPRPLRHEVYGELRDIGIEAVRNAFEHAGATRVDVGVSYEDEHLWLVIADDGSGMDERALATSLKERHFGLLGMRERAERLRATVRMDTAPGEGTEIHVCVPGREAYSRR
jgi:signal transduction histidine kinase/ligand-binding sensor domain-containing protein